MGRDHREAGCDHDGFPAVRMARRAIAGWHAGRGLPQGRANRCPVDFDESEFQDQLRCPDCHSAMERDSDDTLLCTRCSYRAPNEGGVYNLLPSADRAELYPGDREDVIDFCLPSHAERLLEGWYDLEGVFGNKYRWIGGHAAARLVRAKSGPQRLRIRGHASEGHPVELTARANGREVGNWKLDRPGLFIVEADLPESDEYRVEIDAGPTWSVPSDDRVFSVNLSMIRLVPQE